MTEVHPDLTRVDARPITDDKNEIRLFTVGRNELLRLPYFLHYYRQLGVNRFFIIDNDSEKVVVDFLQEQPDCHIFHTRASYAAARAGSVWLNTLLTAYGDGHWTIYADIDELLVYPDCEQIKLPQLCHWLEARNYQGLYALMLDMYGEGAIHAAQYRRGENFLLACALFDSHYHFVPRLGWPFIKKPFPAIEPIGGPRLRLCFAEQNTARLWPRLKTKLIWRFLRMTRRVGFLKRIKAANPAPQAFKIPLVKWQKGYGYITSHRLNPIRLAPMTGALLHFKYFQDFGDRVREAVQRGSHFDGSAEYKRYAELLAQDPALSLVCADSVVYRDSNQLVQLGLIKKSSDWKEA